MGSLREQAEEISEPRLCSRGLSSPHLQLLPLTAASDSFRNLNPVGTGALGTISRPPLLPPATAFKMPLLPRPPLLTTLGAMS